MSEESRGICIIAYNNMEIDYMHSACLAAGYAKKHMKNNQVALITDNGTKGYMESVFDEDQIDMLFDYVIHSDVQHEHNPRRHYDSPWTEFSSQFSNKNKDNIIELTPFDKTLLIDGDYFIQNNYYDHIFETDNPLALHKTAEYLDGSPPYLNERELNEAGIHHWWSTCVYFDQSEESQMFFDLWRLVKENWEYYSLLYQFPPGLFRTDFCVSIAIHLLNGLTNDTFVNDFDSIPLINMDQKDDIIQIDGLTDFKFLVHNRQEQWKNLLVRRQNENLHLMNKRAISRHTNQLLELMWESLNE